MERTGLDKKKKSRSKITQDNMRERMREKLSEMVRIMPGQT